MAKRLWRTGTGNYPNNVVNYLLNTSPLYYVDISKDSRELNLLWKNVTKTLPPFVKETIELVFDERFTLKQTSVRIGTSATTTRRLVRRLHSWLNTDGFAMQPLFNFAVDMGYVYRVEKEDMLKAWKDFIDPKDVSSSDATLFYNYLSNGLLIPDCAKLLGVRTATLMRLYWKAVEMCKRRKEAERH